MWVVLNIVPVSSHLMHELGGKSIHFTWWQNLLQVKKSSQYINIGASKINLLPFKVQAIKAANLLHTLMATITKLIILIEP